MSRAAVFSLLAALVVFCVVQDRVTAAGARRYVALQRAALAGQGPATSVEAVMGPAISRSVGHGLIWSSPFAVAGLGASFLAWRTRRE